MEEFVLNFLKGKENLTPIDIVSDITGLNYDQIRNVCNVIMVDTDILTDINNKDYETDEK